MKPDQDLMQIEIGPHDVNIDARLIGAGLDLDPATVLADMRAGVITSRFERGAGEDAGRYRLTFFHASRRCRIIVDRDGTVLRRSTLDFGEKALPRHVRAM